MVKKREEEEKREQEEDDMAPIEFDDSIMDRYGMMKSLARREVEHGSDTPPSYENS